MRTICCVSLLSVGIIALACNDTAPVEPYPSHPVQGNHSTISDPYERWKAYNLHNYSMVEEVRCFCARPIGAHKVIVRDNNIVDVIRLSDNQRVPEYERKSFLTVDELFARWQHVQADTSVGAVVVEFDDRVGYPTSLFIDYMAYAVDDEVTYRISSLEELQY